MLDHPKEQDESKDNVTMNISDGMVIIFIIDDQVFIYMIDDLLRQGVCKLNAHYLKLFSNNS